MIPAEYFVVEADERLDILGRRHGDQLQAVRGGYAHVEISYLRNHHRLRRVSEKPSAQQTLRQVGRSVAEVVLPLLGRISEASDFTGDHLIDVGGGEVAPDHTLPAFTNQPRHVLVLLDGDAWRGTDVPMHLTVERAADGE